MDTFAESAGASAIVDHPGLQRLWSRRCMTGPAPVVEESDLSDLLSNEEAFPSAFVDVVDEDVHGKPSASVTTAFACNHGDVDRDDCLLFTETELAEISREVRTERPRILDGATLKDIPARYTIPPLQKYEMPVVGVYIDPRVVTGFRYRVRPVDEEKHLFGGEALQLESIGRGYSRRLTFKANLGTLNSNDNYFWSDSFPSGFAFELEVIGPGERFTIFDANQLPLGDVRVLDIQAPQEEVSQRTDEKGGVEKTVRVELLGKVDWYNEEGPAPVVQVTGLAICKKQRANQTAEVCRVVSVTVGSHSRRGYTMTPGINSRQRLTVVKGSTIKDVPTSYTVVGLESYELPVIGTYVDPRIAPGFQYRVRPLGLKRRHLFDGKSLILTSIGCGYGKRMTFQPLPGSLNNNDNFFWSDSFADGLGFEPRAVDTGARFTITADGLQLGEASVFRADAPQFQEHQEIEKTDKGVTLRKYIHVDLTCHVTLNTNGMPGKNEDAHVMRVSGTALLEKTSREATARLLKIENIGLDSQLNVLFVIQHAHLVFHPA